MALIDSGEQDHERCRKALPALSAPLVTIWPVITEAMFLLDEAGGWKAQTALWALIRAGTLQVADITDRIDRMFSLMEKYRDVPMSLADAGLVALAEARNLKRVFTLDSDFTVYRHRGKEPIELVPSPL